MKTATQLEKQAQRMVTSQPTDVLVDSFNLTDRMFEDTMSGKMTTDDYLAVVQAREWVLDELASRGELHLIGLCSRCLSELVEGECKDVDCMIVRCTWSAADRWKLIVSLRKDELAKLTPNCPDDRFSGQQVAYAKGRASSRFARLEAERAV